MSAKRDEAKGIVDQAIPLGMAYTSNESPPDYKNHYELWTGVNHKTLLADWLGGGQLTACNGFVNIYANKLGITDISAWFELHRSLIDLGKQRAWIPAAATAPLPKYGDILRHKKFHVDVAIGFDACHRLVRAGAGMPDGTKHAAHGRNPMPSTAERALEYDVLRRITGDAPYNWQNLEGWLDLDLYFAPAPKAGPVPAWLVGWWNVIWRGQTWYYHFDQNQQATWTQVPPLDPAQPPLFANDTGDVTLEPFSIAVRWRATGNVERFRSVLGSGDTALTGKWNNTEQVIASKM